MPIEYSEISSSGISQSEFNTLSSTLRNIDKQVMVYRQSPSFNTNVGNLSRDATTLFAAMGDDNGILRAFISGGNLFVEHYTVGGGWQYGTTLSSSVLNIPPKVVSTGSDYWVFAVLSDGTITKWFSNDGTSWGGPTAFSTYLLPTDGTLEYISHGAGNIPIVYAIINSFANNNARNIIAVDATTAYDTGIYWPSAITGFACRYMLLAPDDTSGVLSDSDLRHVIVLAGATAPIYVFHTVNGLPVKQPQYTGGLVSFIIRPPNSGRPIQTSRYYPIDLSDNTALQNRVTCSLTPSSSIHSSNLHDTLFCAAYGKNGDVNSSDTSYSYPVIAYYSTRDGKHWSQDKLIEWTDVSGTLPDFSKGIQLVKYLTKLYLVTAEGLLSSPGCLEWNNPDPAETVDITPYVLSYNSSIYDSRQTRLTLSNRNAILSQTILGSGISLGMITKLGNTNYKFQVAVEEIDSIQPARERPNELIEISARDRMGWINDRSANANAIQWDNQVIGRDDYIDIGGNKNAGLAHTATVVGTFTTSNNTLVANTKYKENIAFNTYKAMVEDGGVSAIVSIPNPTSQGGTSSADSPSYAGVIFRAIDKDNFWFCWYNYWTNKIELGERRNGESLVYESIAPSSIFQLLGQNGGSVGIRVEFKGARIRVYEGINYYSSDLFHGADYQFDLEYIAFADNPAIPRWLEGYVGVISSGFSDQDTTTSDIPPDPIVISPSGPSSTFGPISSFVPTKILLLRSTGDVMRGSPLVASPTWVQIGMPNGVRDSMSGSSGGDGFLSGPPISMAIIDATQNPFNANEVIVLGSRGIALLTNPFTGTESWTVTSITPHSGYSFGTISGYTNDQKSGKIEGSINILGYFGWYEIPNSGSANIYYCYTTDHFASYHRVDLGIAWQRGAAPNGNTFGISFNLDCFASSIGSMKIWLNVGTTLKQSNTGGASWSSYSYTMPHAPGGGSYPGDVKYDGGCSSLNMPFSHRGGGNNSNHIGLWTYEVQLDPFGSYSHPTDWVIGPTGLETPLDATGSALTGYGPRMLQSLTIDANHLAVVASDTCYISSDGGLTWPIKFNAPSHSSTGGSFVNGWPTNPNFLIFGSGNELWFTIDGGASATSVSHPTLSGGTGVMAAFADFSEVYPVTGIHP